MVKKSLIIANWKMNPQTYKEAEKIVTEVSKGIKGEKNADVVFCPPFPWLADISRKNKKALIGAQNMFYEKEGAFTGEISAKMLASSGVKYVILGHSERRALGETNEMINKKIIASLKAGLVPVVCVGERERDAGHAYMNDFKQQVTETFMGIPAASLKKIVIAYEPVWAIGARATREATPEETTEMIIFLKRILFDMFGKNYTEPRFIYGGSITPENAQALLLHGGVSGLLVGRNSLNPKKFLKIVKSANT